MLEQKAISPQENQSSTFRVGKFVLPQQEEYTSRDIINYTGMSPAQISNALKRAEKEGQPIEFQISGRRYLYDMANLKKLLTFAPTVESASHRHSPRLLRKKPVDKKPERPKNELPHNSLARKEVEERLALRSFDENDFGIRVCLTIFSNLENEDAAKEFPRDISELLNASCPTDIKLSTLIGSKSAEEYAMDLVVSTVTRSRAKNPSQRSEREQWVLGLYKKLGQKDQFRQDVLANVFDWFGIEYKTPTSSPAPEFPKD